MGQSSGAMRLLDALGVNRAKVNTYGDQVVSISNPTALLGGIYASVTATGALQTQIDSTYVFADEFDGVAVDTNRWTTLGTVVPTVGSGVMAVNPGATASATSVAVSVPAFSSYSTQVFGTVVTIEAAVTLGNHRFWGLAQPAATIGTSAAPLTDAVGFEVDTAGALRASVYSNGTRVFTSVLTRPTDGAAHRYSVIVRGDVAFWYLDNFDLPIASSQVGSQSQLLYVRVHSLNSASVTVGTPTLAATGFAMYDNGRNATQLADGQYPHRKATISAAGQLSVALGGATLGTASAGALTAAVGVNTAVTTLSTQVTAAVASAGNVTFHVAVAAFVGTLVFEGSLDGGLNWAPMVCIREDGTGADSGLTLSTASAFIRQYTVALAGYSHFKVRCSAYTSGAAAIYMVPGPFLIEPNPTLAAGVAQIGSMSLASPNSAALNMYVNVNPYGTQRVTVEPTVLFFDAFDGTLDTNKWVISGTQAPTSTNGQAILAPTVGASVANNALLVSQATFVSPGVGFLTFSCTATLEATSTTAVNVHRFWGKGQVTSFTYATPLTDAIGFEVAGDGSLQCVVWVGGTRYVINSTTVSNITSSLNGAVAGGTPAGTALPSGAVASAYGKPLTWQGGTHRYAIMIRSDVIYWFVEGVEVPVAVLSYLGPNVQQMPVRVHSITNNAATSLANTFAVGAFAVNDNTAQNNTISDPIYQFRRAWVTAGNGLQVAPVDGGKATYTVSAVAIAAPSGIFASFVGSSTKLCRITRIRVSAIGTTAATIDVTVQKTSTAPSGGTLTNPTKMPVDSNDVAATATFNAYTAVPTTGTVVGTVGAAKMVAPLTGVALTPTEFTFGGRPGARALVLRGNTQAIQLVASAAVAGASFDIEIEWTEE